MKTVLLLNSVAWCLAFLRNVGNRVLGEEHSLHQMLFSIIMTEYKRSW